MPDGFLAPDSFDLASDDLKTFFKPLNLRHQPLLNNKRDLAA
jgi:hypothetical protein